MRPLIRPQPFVLIAILSLVLTTSAASVSSPAVAAVAVAASQVAILEDSLFADLQWRNIGPANMAGRMTDIEAVGDDFSTVFAAAASGGVLRPILSRKSSKVATASSNLPAPCTDVEKSTSGRPSNARL